VADTKITLMASGPATGELPVSYGNMTLSLVDYVQLTLIAPFRGQTDEVSKALKTAIGMGLPAVGKATQSKGTSIQWFGRGQYMLAGTEAPSILGAAITDQSDGWVSLDLYGPEVAQVMARLVPVDLRAKAFAEGTAIRTDLHGMMVAITRPGSDTVRIMGFRSMARSLTHTITDAMAHVAALG